ncbi:hypothetical protein ACFYO7_09130 [Nocardia salmonicida]|uniref:hypothetical protein n=1 Tax=Nocardia salmonicida TaxID=53431 RepID=UPI0036CDAD5A
MVDIRRPHRIIAAATAAVAAGALAVACTASTTTKAGPTQDAPRPTVVLVHGAFADGSSWNDVVDQLLADRYPVVAVADPLGGPAAAGTDQVRSLVYGAAFQPASGETALELTDKFSGSTLPGTLDPVPFTAADGSAGTDLYIQQAKYPAPFAADVIEQAADTH